MPLYPKQELASGHYNAPQLLGRYKVSSNLNGKVVEIVFFPFPFFLIPLVRRLIAQRLMLFFQIVKAEILGQALIQGKSILVCPYAHKPEPGACHLRGCLLYACGNSWRLSTDQSRCGHRTLHPSGSHRF